MRRHNNSLRRNALSELIMSRNNKRVSFIRFQRSHIRLTPRSRAQRAPSIRARRSSILDDEMLRMSAVESGRPNEVRASAVHSNVKGVNGLGYGVYNERVRYDDRGVLYLGRSRESSARVL